MKRVLCLSMLAVMITAGISPAATTIVTRTGKGSTLTYGELDANFTNLKSTADAALPAASYTAGDVLNKIKTVDGAGSGLDADTADGLQVSQTGAASSIVATDANGNVLLGGASNYNTGGIGGVKTGTGQGFSLTDGTNSWTQYIKSGSAWGLYKIIGGVGTDTLIVDASGNFGLRTTPSAWGGAVAGSIQIGHGGVYAYSNDSMGLSNNKYYDGLSWKGMSNGVASQYDLALDGSFRWYTASDVIAGQTVTDNMRMTLTNAGSLVIGASDTTAKLSVQGGDVFIGANSNIGSGGKIAITSAGDGIHTSTPAGSAAAAFYVSGATVGGIYVSANSTSFSTSSDYRLKSDVAPISDALHRVSLLNPVKYIWKADGSTGEGFLAHELQMVIPQAVSGKKDAVDSTGVPIYQSVDYSKVVPVLTAAIQELKAEIDQLKAQIAH